MICLFDLSLFFEEFLIVLLIYNFLKLVIFNSIFELIWPTHFFNRKNNYNFKKCRSFVGFILKLRPKNYFYLTFYKSYLNFYFK